MSLKEDIEEIQEKAEILETQSFAKSILEDYKKANKRMFWIWIITFIALVGVTCYLIYVKSDTGVIKQTIEVDGVEQIDNSHIKIGDDIWEKSK